MFEITLVDKENCKWIREQTKLVDNKLSQSSKMAMARTHMEERRWKVNRKSDRLGNN